VPRPLRRSRHRAEWLSYSTCGLMIKPIGRSFRRVAVAIGVLVAVGWAPFAWTRPFHVTPVERPAADVTEIYAITKSGQLGGSFLDRRGGHGWLCDIPCNPSAMRTLDPWFHGMKARSTQIRGLSSGGLIAGTFSDRDGERHGFLCDGPRSLECHQIDVRLNQTTMAETMIFALDEDGTYGGAYRDHTGHLHGFVSRDDHFLTVDVPKSVLTMVHTIGPLTTVGLTLGGLFVDSQFQMHGFLCTLPVQPTCFAAIDVVLTGVVQTMTQVNGLAAERLVGTFRDQAGDAHGFQCSLPVTLTCFMQVDAYGMKNTEVLGINAQGQLIGRYQDGNGRQHAFVSRPGG